MAKIRVRDAAARAKVLIPFDAGSIKGDYAAVLTPVSSLPQRFREAQQARTDAYMTSGDRNAPTYAPRYIVTSNGLPVAWVTMDGATHYETADYLSSTTRRHRDMIKAVWPAAFDVTERGFGS